MNTNQQEQNWKDRLDSYHSPVPDNFFDRIATGAPPAQRPPYRRRALWVLLLLLAGAALIYSGNKLGWYGGGTVSPREVHVTSREAGAVEKRSEELRTASSATGLGSEDTRTVDLQSARHTAVETSVRAKAAAGVAGAAGHNSADGSYTGAAHTRTRRSADAGMTSAGEAAAAGATGIATPTADEARAVLNEMDLLPATAPRTPALAPLSVLLKSVDRQEALLSLPKVDPDDCYSFGPSRSGRLYIDVFGGVGQAFRRLESGADSRVYAQLRDSLESNWYTNTAGARIGWMDESGVAIEAGLTYGMINEVFKYTNAQEVRTSIRDIYDPVTGNLVRTDTITETGARYITSYNRYRTLNLPVRIGYTWSAERWSVGLRAGAAFNLLYNRRGTIMDESRSIYDIAADTSGYFKPRTGIAADLSLQVAYQLAGNWAVFAEPCWNAQLSPVTEPGYSVRQSYRTAHIQIGIRFTPGNE